MLFSRLITAALLVACGALLVRAQQPDLYELEEKAVRSVISRLGPSVVSIETVGGLEKVGKLLVGTGPTTGLVVSEDGYVLSSAFNFVSQPASILVGLPSGKRAAAKIVARDTSRMLVLLKVATDEKLQVPTVVPRAEMTVGQTAIALGHTFDGPTPNVSVGILSAKSRIWGKAIQTDAKISPSNYGGPLADLRGRVLGILVPLSPQGNDEVAGTEWYDSGIGFAVPLEDVMRHIEKLKKGENLSPGLLGINLKQGDMYSLPATIAAVQPNSPAAKAGIKAEDQIVEIDGTKIEQQAQLKHALGPRYAGDTVALVVLRGQQRVEAKIPLVEKLVPYQHPFVGILPMRERGSEKGVVVRFVYPKSPAEAAGIKAGDRIVSLDGKDVADPGTFEEQIAGLEKGVKVKLGVRRGSESLNLDVATAALPTAIPAALPAAHAEKSVAGVDRPAVGAVEIRLPEESNTCLAYVPESYHPDVPHGVVVWLHGPGGYEKDALLARWKDVCAKHDLILIAPASKDKAKWDPTEAPYIRKTIDDVIGKYNVDRSRIVVQGYQGGAALAYLVAFAQRDLIRGVAAVDSPLPQRAAAPANEPINRLAFYSAWSEKSQLADRIKGEMEKVSGALFPVTTKTFPEAARDLNAAELSELARWIDSLDRI